MSPYDDRSLLPLNWYNLIGIHDTSTIDINAPHYSTQEIIHQILDIVGSMGTRNALTYLVSLRAFSEFGNQDEFTSKDINIPPRMLEYAIALTGSFRSNEQPSAALAEESHSGRLSKINSLSSDDIGGGYRNVSHRVYGLESILLLRKLEQLYAELMNNYKEFDLQDVDSRLAAATHESELVYGHYAYPEQYIEAMERVYTPYQLDFLVNTEIDMAKASHWAQQILTEYHDRTGGLFREARLYQADCLRLVGGISEAIEQGTALQRYLSSPQHAALQHSELTSWAQFISSAEDILWISSEQLKTQLALYNRRRIEAFLDRISVTVGEYEQSVTSPFGYNQLERTPLLEHEGDYLLGHPRMFARALSRTFFYDLGEIEKADDVDLLLDFNHRGDAFEQWAFDRVAQLFVDDGDHVIANLEWSNPNREIDIIAKCGSTALAVEVKSKFLSNKSRKGNIDGIKKDLREGIIGAADQLDRKIKNLSANEWVLSNADTDVPFDNRDIDEWLPVAVMGGQYDRISTTEYVSQIDEKKLIPYVLSIYDLDTLSRIITTEHFVDYVRERIELAEKRQVQSVDEIDFLGLYARTGGKLYQDPVIGRTFGEMASSELIDVTADISGADEEIRQVLTEFEHQYPVTWLLNHEIP